MKRNTTSSTRVLAFLLFCFACCHALASGTLVYSGTNIMERWQNDGRFDSNQNLLTVTLSGDNFTNLAANTDFIAGGQVTATNVPYGLTPVAFRTATNKVTVSLSGFANTNGPSATANGLQFVFNDSAFSNGPASSIAWAGGSNLTVSFLSAASNWYVSASGSEANTGMTIGSPFRSITNAIKHARANANDVINIAAGTYTITNQPAIAITTKNLTFSGTNAALTILQAGATPGTATNGIFSYSQMNGYNAMFLNLTMQNGRAGAGSGGGGGGGAIYAYTYNADLIATNCVFINNSATTANGGGAITHAANTAGSYLTLISCIFSNNVATNIAASMGGAIYAADNMTISNCVFVGNGGGTNGGAVSISGSCTQPASIINTLFINNASLTGLGGGGYFGGTGPVGIYGCTFASNSAPLGGGGFYVKGALAVTNSTCYANTSTIGVGGGINSGYANFPGLLIYNSTIFGNTASNGGGIYLSHKEGATIYSSIIAGNTASSGLAPDIVPSQTTIVQWLATNSLIGATNGIGNGTLVASLTNGAPNAYGNYCGSTVAPQLSGLLPLAWNGGVQPTCALLPTSVAIHHGYNPLGLPYDERGPGYARSNNQGQTDMGAYEYGSQPPVVASPGTTVFFR